MSHRLRTLCLTLVALAVLVGPAFAAPLKSDGRTASFAEVVRAHFRTWDANGDGRLTFAEVAALVHDPRVTGDAAAALAAIHIFQIPKNHRAVPLTLEFLTRLPNSAERTRRDQEEDRPQFQEDFAVFAKHLAEAPRAVFARETDPLLAAVHQGHVGDCYFLAAVGALIHRDRTAVRPLIQINDDGSSTVRFPARPPIRVAPLTDAEIALGGAAGAEGTWINVLERGFNLIEVRSGRKKVGKAVGLDAINDGGDADETIALLTGHRTAIIAIRKENARQAPGERRLKELLPRIRAALRDATEQKMLICASTPQGAMPPGLVDEHEYAVLHFDAEADVVHLWNPWGDDFAPKGPPSLTHGYPTTRGRFAMPLRELVLVFDEVIRETPRPLRGKK